MHIITFMKDKKAGYINLLSQVLSIKGPKIEIMD
jgi:hypothetical protein